MDTDVKVPAGALASPKVSSPQQTTVPSGLAPQVWYLPTETEAKVKAGTVVKYDSQGNFPAGKVADVCVAVVGEQPYAEGRGDKEDLSLAPADVKMTEGMRDKCQKLVVVLISGRPMIVTDPLKQWDAFVAAWLPGTEGQGVADVLFGDKPFTGKLPYTWPRSNDQLPFDFKNLGSGDQGPLFPLGYGLTQ